MSSSYYRTVAYPFFIAVVSIQGIHVFEHIVQLAQFYLFGVPNDQAFGLLRYLIRFDGFRGEWNGRVVFHRETPAGSGLDYSTQVKGARWVGVVVRDGATEAYPVGDKGPFHVVYDEVASKAASPQAVIDQFRKQKM